MSESKVIVNAEMPNSDEAEATLLGAILIHNELIFEVADRLHVDHFGRHWCGLVFSAMLKLTSSKEPIDYISVMNALGAAGTELVGVARLAKLTDGMPQYTAKSIAHYADIVIDRALKRALIHEAQRAIEVALVSPAPAEDLIRATQDAVFHLGQQTRSETMFSAQELTARTWKRLTALDDRSYAMTGIPTGIHDLDVMTNGFNPGELVVLGARPSVGKTALALQFALWVAQTVNVLFCSLEMAHQAVWDRALFNFGRINGYRLVRGHLRDDLFTGRQIAYAMGKLDPLKLWLDEQSGMSPMDIRAKAQQLKLRHGGLALIVVDYLQLMRPSDKQSARTQNRTQIVGDMCRDLKDIAKELQAVVIVLSQLRRAADEKSRPDMSDLRESGDIEAHADIIILPHRKESREELNELPVGTPSHIELLMEKQRGNPTGIINLLNFREQYRFVSERRGDVDPAFDEATA